MPFTRSFTTPAFAASSLEHARRCQRTPRLAHLRGLRSGLDRPGAAAVPGRWLRRSTRANRLRAGFHDHRSLPDALSLGALPSPQGSDQAAHAPRPAREYPLFRADYPRQDPRRHRPGHLADRARHLLRGGPGLSRLRPTLSLEVGLGVLRDSGQEQPRLPPTLVPSRGQDHGIATTKRSSCAARKHRSSTPTPCVAWSTATPRQASGSCS